MNLLNRSHGKKADLQLVSLVGKDVNYEEYLKKEFGLQLEENRFGVQGVLIDNTTAAGRALLAQLSNPDTCLATLKNFQEVNNFTEVCIGRNREKALLIFNTKPVPACFVLTGLNEQQVGSIAARISLLGGKSVTEYRYTTVITLY